MIDSILYIPNISAFSESSRMPEGDTELKNNSALIYTRTNVPIDDPGIIVLASATYTGTGTVERVYKQIKDDPEKLATYTSVYDTSSREIDDGEGGTQTVMPPFKFGMLAESMLPAPSEITPRQARLALAKHNLLNSVNDAIAAISDETQRQIAEIEWEYATSIERSAPWVTVLYGALGLSPTEVDSLFVEASTL